MLTTLALMAALSTTPGQNGDLQLGNVRATYGVLGALRPKDEIIPGDMYFITFDIQNLKTDDQGRVQYSMGIELKNPKGETEFKRDPDPKPLMIFNPLGGARVPAFAHALVGPEMPDGKYEMIVTVYDGMTKKKAELKKAFTVSKKAFGIVKLNTSYDGQGTIPAPFMGVAGQSLYVNFWVVGFERKPKGQPNIKFEVYVEDENGKRTSMKSMEDNVNKEVPDDWVQVPMNFLLPLNRVGKFNVVLKAKDVLASKDAELTFPIVVTELK